MNFAPVSVFYILLPVLLFWGAKVSKKKEWNEEIFSFDHTKAFLGFAAIAIMFHHMSQRLCAPWLPQDKVVHGLDGYVYVGYLYVSVFLFCSGYGMYTASRKGDSFFKGYFVRRMLPIALAPVPVWFAFFAVERIRKIKIDPPILINTYDYTWYIYAMLWLYLIFFLVFHLVKKEKLQVPLLWAGVLLYDVLAYFFSPGTWWYNTPHIFVLGVMVARNKDRVLARLKKGYAGWIALSFIVTEITTSLAESYWALSTVLHWKQSNAAAELFQLTNQLVGATFFTLFVILMGMKIRVGNPVIRFLGTFTLELYVVHPFFVQLFAYSFVLHRGKPVFHIQNQILYVLAVIALSVPIAYGWHLVLDLLRGRKKKKEKA